MRLAVSIASAVHRRGLEGTDRDLDAIDAGGAVAADTLGGCSRPGGPISSVSPSHPG